MLHKQLEELEHQIFCESCADDGISPRLRELWRLRDKLKEELKMKCEATIEFGDDFGDNHSTFHCQLEKGHEGEHQEIGDMGTENYKMPYTLKWEGTNDELEKSYPSWDDEDQPS